MFKHAGSEVCIRWLVQTAQLAAHTQSCFICWAQATTTACSPALPLTGAHAQRTWCCTHACVTSQHTQCQRPPQRKRTEKLSRVSSDDTGWNPPSLTYTDTYSQKILMYAAFKTCQDDHIYKKDKTVCQMQKQEENSNFT